MLQIKQKYIYSNVLVNEILSLDLTTYENYSSYLASIANLDDIINSIELNTTTLQDSYARFINSLLSAALPISESSLLGSNANPLIYDTDLYAALKNIFIKFCSYNVQFLDNNDEEIDWLFMSIVNTDESTKSTASYELNNNIYDIIQTEEIHKDSDSLSECNVNIIEFPSYEDSITLKNISTMKLTEEHSTNSSLNTICTVNVLESTQTTETTQYVSMGMRIVFIDKEGTF